MNGSCSLIMFPISIVTFKNNTNNIVLHYMYAYIYYIYIYIYYDVNSMEIKF